MHAGALFCSPLSLSPSLSLYLRLSFSSTIRLRSTRSFLSAAIFAFASSPTGAATNVEAPPATPQPPSAPLYIDISLLAIKFNLSAGQCFTANRKPEKRIALLYSARLRGWWPPGCDAAGGCRLRPYNTHRYGVLLAVGMG